MGSVEIEPDIEIDDPFVEQLTDWFSPRKMLRSEYGMLTYDEWMVKEIERMSGDGRILFVRGKKRYIALFERHAHEVVVEV